MLSVYLRTTYYFDPVLRHTGSILTIHNVEYQGWFPPQTTERLLLPWEVFTMDKLESYNTFNFLKGGIAYSDTITTVSRKYAEEIQTSEFGNGLDAILRKRAADLHGILDGVDYSQWNPATDHNIAAHYTPENLAGKTECRRDLLHAFCCEQVSPTTPVLGIVSRFATAKGFDLIAQIADRLLSEDVCVIALGTGEPYYEGLMRSFQDRYPGKISVRIAFDDVLAHKVQAGSDLLLVPSHFEPSGLTQMYSLKYGTVPVVRATGGLDDSVEEWNPDTRTGAGFKFYGYNPDDFLAAIHRALHIFRTDRDTWTQIMQNGMAQDFSWKKAAAEYAALYEEVARRRN